MENVAIPDIGKGRGAQLTAPFRFNSFNGGLSISKRGGTGFKRPFHYMNGD